MSNYHSGKFTPKNPKKYRGNVHNIQFRSGWELKMMIWLDENPNVIAYASEEIAIQYQHPFKGRTARYFPDFIADIKDIDGKIQRYLIEIKPEKETIQPIKKSRQKTKTWMYAEATWAINQKKWEAAQRFCAANNMKFKLITERELFNRR